MPGLTSGYERSKEILAGAEPPSYLLFIAPDRVRRERMVQSFAQKFFGSKDASPLRRIKGGGFSSKDLLFLRDESHALSLFSARRFVLVEDIELIKAEPLKEVIEVLKTLPQSGFSIILFASELPASNALLKLCAKEERLVELSLLQDSELRKWAIKELASQGVSDCPAAALEALIAASEGDLDLLAQNISQLALFSEGGAVSVNDIEQLFSEKVSANEYELLDYLARRDRPGAELQLATLLRSGKNAFLLLSMIARSYTSYVAIRSCLDQRMTAALISERLKIPPWLLKKHLSAVSNRSRQNLIKDVRAILRADSRLKNRSLGPDAVLSSLVYDLTGGAPH